MKKPIAKLVQFIQDARLTESEKKSIAIQMACEILNSVDFELELDFDGCLTVFSEDGNIVYKSKGFAFEHHPDWKMD